MTTKANLFAVWLLAGLLLAAKGDEILKENDFRLTRAETRNIIFVGRTRSGKTTSIEVIKDQNHNPKDATILRGTMDAKLSSFIMHSNSQNQSYAFNMIDTPGLFELSADVNDKRTNQIILNTIRKCIDMEITKINHVYFVMSLERGLNDEDIQSFQLFAELFLGMEEKISLIFSWAQRIAPSNYHHYIDQFKSEPRLHQLYNTIGGRVFFLGAAKDDGFAKMDKIRANVYQQRAALFQHIINQNETYNVKQLKVYKDNIEFLKRLHAKFAKECKDSTMCDDVLKFGDFIKQYNPQNDDETEETEKTEL